MVDLDLAQGERLEVEKREHFAQDALHIGKEPLALEEQERSRG